MKRKILIMILKAIIYIATLCLGLLGASAVTSCSSPSPTLLNRGTIIVNDTIYLHYGYK